MLTTNREPLLVCARHHTLIHQQHFRLVLHPDRRLDVGTADGVSVLHHPALPWGDRAALDPTGRVAAEALPPAQTEARMDLGYVVSVLLQTGSVRIAAHGRGRPDAAPAGDTRASVDGPVVEVAPLDTTNSR
jgi:hypothetical protein